MAVSSPWFQDQSVPAFEYLSEGSREALEAFVSAGNRSFRTQQLTEFFKCLDWLPVEEIPNNPLQKLAPAVQKQVMRDIRQYLLSKAEDREKASERRKAYLLKVFEYYRQHVSPSDKALLEGLRDYELNLTGRDANWQHHFSMKSYKKIDAFLAETQAERMARIAQFKADVATYQRNMERLRHAANCQDEGHVFDFDDWCDWIAGEDTHRRQAHQGRGRTETAPGGATGLGQAYHALGMAIGQPMEAVKKQFRQLTLQHHPDMPGGNAERMKTIIAAYEQIKRHWSLLSDAGR
jgi:DnaJ-domain-containing protein 1